MNYTVYAAGKEVTAVAMGNAVSINSIEVVLGKIITDNYIELVIKGKRTRAYYKSTGNLTGEVFIENRAVPVRIEPENIRRVREILGVRTGVANNSVLQIMSPMPGLIAKILVRENSTVSIGDRLCVLEAMKMENEIRSTANGVISKIYVKERETVEKGKPMMEIKLT